MSRPVELQKAVVEGSGPGPHLLITGGVHGDEFESMAAIRRLIRHFEGSAREELRGRLTLVPVVNEAAYLRGTRTAGDGLDLARVCPGDPNGSVTRRTAHALGGLIGAADYYIDLHTGGSPSSVWPMSGYGLHPDPEILDRQRAMAQGLRPAGDLGHDRYPARPLPVGCPRRRRRRDLRGIPRLGPVRSGGRGSLLRRLPERHGHASP